LYVQMIGNITVYDSIFEENFALLGGVIFSQNDGSAYFKSS